MSANQSRSGSSKVGPAIENRERDGRRPRADINSVRRQEQYQQAQN
jgi:hypothetical protein